MASSKDYLEFVLEQLSELDDIGKIGGPRCCKRDSYLAILTAIDFVKEHFDVEMEKNKVVYIHSDINNQCIGSRCPFVQRAE